MPYGIKLLRSDGKTRISKRTLAMLKDGNGGSILQYSNGSIRAQPVATRCCFTYDGSNVQFLY